VDTTAFCANLPYEVDSRMAETEGFCSLMGQGRGSSLVSTPWDACVSLRARSALDGVTIAPPTRIGTLAVHFWIAPAVIAAAQLESIAASSECVASP
jgi:hypothetical protein